MFSTNAQDSSSTARPGPTDADRRNPTATSSSTHQPHPQSGQQQGSTMGYVPGTGSYPQQQQQPSHPKGTTEPYPQHEMPGTSSYPQQQQPSHPKGTTEPYPQQETTWWEEAHSPHPGNVERGYGPGPSGGHVGGGMSGGQYQQQQHGQHGPQGDQYGQYGGRTRDDKRAHENQDVVNWNKVAKIICSIFLPPLGVFLETGCDKNFAINVLLTILGYLPGIIHALYVIFMD